MRININFLFTMIENLNNLIILKNPTLMFFKYFVIISVVISIDYYPKFIKTLFKLLSEIQL